jgi:hypothetical protein
MRRELPGVTACLASDFSVDKDRGAPGNVDTE